MLQIKNELRENGKLRGLELSDGTRRYSKQIMFDIKVGRIEGNHLPEYCDYLSKLQNSPKLPCPMYW